MRDRRELILFVIVAALAGFLTLNKVNAGYTRARVPAANKLPVPDLAHPATARLRGVDAPAEGERGSGAFAPPRELLPLDPLDLPEPPLPVVDIRLPAIDPGVADPMAYRVSSDGFGQLELPDEALGESEEDVGEGDLSGFSTADPGNATPAAVEPDSPDDLYDWVVRSGSTRRTYGRLLNPDVYGLSSRPGEDFTFQQVTVRNGRPLGVPFAIPREEVLEFGLARTFENLYHLRSRSLGSGSGSVRTRSELALEMLAAADEHDQAVAFAEAEAARAWESSPTDPYGARLLATVRAASHDLEGQMAVYREAEGRGLSDAALLSDYAMLARDLGLSERAEELVARADLVSNTAAEVSLTRGLLAADRGEHEAALADFVETGRLRFSPPFVEQQERLASLARGRSLLALGRASEARREAERLMLESPEDADALHLLGSALAVEGSLSEAADAFSRALIRNPDSSETLTAAGLVAWQQGDGAGARRLLERARDAEPWNALRPTAALAVLHEDAGRMTRARDLYDEALAVVPDDPETLYRLGRLQRWSGDPDTAHTTLRRALRLGGADVLLLAELGTAALLSDSAPAASGYLREALRLEAGDSQVLWLLGITHLKEGDLLGAVERLEEAAAAGASGAHAALGVARYRLGDAASALDHFDEVERAYAGRSEHPQAMFAASQAAAIRDNLAKRQWLDAFGRSQLQRGWTERQWDGSPRVMLVGGGVSIAGRMEKPREDERPGIARTVEGRTVVSVEAGMAAGGPGDTRFGLSVTHKQVKGVLGQLPKGRLEIWVDRTGAVRLSALDNFETVVLDGVEVGVTIPAGERVALGIERTDSVNGSFRFLLDGRRVGEPVTLKSMRDLTRNTLHVDIWGEAPPGRAADVRVDLVRIVRLP
jgi:tetratricopeptide (TPR) repeat protein